MNRSTSSLLQILAVSLAIASAAGCVKRSGHQISRLQRVADEPHVALDGSGHGIGIWTEADVNPLAPDSGLHGGGIVVAAFEAGSGFAVPIDLYEANPSDSPRVGMHADGAARACWFSKGGTTAAPRSLVFAATLAASVWSVELLQEAPAFAHSLSLATNRRGDALLAWWSDRQVYVALASPGSGWSAPIALGGADDVIGDDPAVCAALGQNGEGVVVRTIVEAGRVGVFAHHFRPGSDPLVPVAIDDGLECQLEDDSDHHLAAVVDADGSATAAWIARGTSSATGLAVNRYDAGLAWHGATALVPLDDSVTELYLACDLSGTVHVQWNGFRLILRTSYTAASGWRAPTFVGTDADWAAFAVAPNGCAIGLATTSEGPASSCIADVLPPANGWSGLRDVVDAGRQQDVAIEESGLAVALSLRDIDDPLTFLPETAVIASVWQAPQVTIAAPPTASPGAAIVFDASATEIRSTDAGVARCEWDFDSDGIVDATFPDASGLTISHAYPLPGIYDVRLRIADTWGYAGTATVTVDVTAGGGDGPPWRLVVAESGGTGVVTSDDDDDGDGVPDLRCPTDCEEFYGDAELVFLRAVPDPGFHFVRWDGLDSGNGDMDYGIEGCLVRMTAHRTVTAVFEPSNP